MNKPPRNLGRLARPQTLLSRAEQVLREAIARGWTHFKMKVGRGLEEDLRRAAIIREEIGRDRVLMMDANQVWDVPDAVAAMRALARFDPLWIEEPTSPDDVLGHARIDTTQVYAQVRPARLKQSVGFYEGKALEALTK